MQYRVPQNIDQEDKILGPLTFVQFVYVLIGGALLLILFSVLDLALFLLLGIPIAVITIAFALIKVQDQPFSRFFMSVLVYLKQPKHRIWQDQDSEPLTRGLGEDYEHDLHLEETSPAAATATISPPTPPATATEQPAAASASSSLANQIKKILPIQQPKPSGSPVPPPFAFDDPPTPTAISTDQAFAASPPPPATPEPPKPARRLAISVDKGGR